MSPIRRQPWLSPIPRCLPLPLRLTRGSQLRHLKPFGLRVPDCGSSAFVRRAEEVVPPELTLALAPVLERLRVLEAELGRYEKQIEQLAAVS